jgi:hypothetical protein
VLHNTTTTTTTTTTEPEQTQKEHNQEHKEKSKGQRKALSLRRKEKGQEQRKEQRQVQHEEQQQEQHQVQPEEQRDETQSDHTMESSHTIDLIPQPTTHMQTLSPDLQPANQIFQENQNLLLDQADHSQTTHIPQFENYQDFQSFQSNQFFQTQLLQTSFTQDFFSNNCQIDPSLQGFFQPTNLQEFFQPTNLQGFFQPQNLQGFFQPDYTDLGQFQPITFPPAPQLPPWEYNNNTFLFDEQLV